MTQMKTLYEKVAADPSLQEKFNGILQDAEKAGEAETQNRLLSFAKEAGYEIGMDEMLEFFQNLAQAREGELSDLELDMVAGGKSTAETGYTIALSISTIGLGCSALIGAQRMAVSLVELNRCFQE